MEKGLQYRRTDRAIMNAFIKLVNQGSFEKLTVQEILDEALVSRNTFYAHYRDKYVIAEQLFKKYKEDFLKLLKESYTDIGKEWAGTSQFQEFSDLPARLFFQFYQEHKDLIYALNKIKTDKVDMDQFVSQLFRERYLCATRPDKIRSATWNWKLRSMLPSTMPLPIITLFPVQTSRSPSLTWRKHFVTFFCTP